MTVSKRAKGNAYQRKCAKWIEENYNGAKIHNQTATASAYIDNFGKAHYRNPKGTDILGCIDILAIIPGCKVVFIQASMDEHVQKRLKDMVQVPWNLDHCIVQLWLDRGYHPGFK